MFGHRSRLGPVDLAFTDRIGGVSAAPYDSLNLGLADADDPAARAENLRRALADFAPDLAPGPPVLAQARQVHGCSVAVVGAGSLPALASELPEADGLVSVEADVVLLVRVADCVPVLLADPGAGVIGVAHAGRAGMVSGIAPRVVETMRAHGAAGITAWLGPRICGRCYEVPEQMRTEVGAEVPDAVATTSWGTPALDIGAGVAAQLRDCGVEVHDVGPCTYESAELFSHRRDAGRTGRQAGLIRRRR